MKTRTLIPLVIGLGVGFFAIKMGVDMVQKAKGAPTESSQIFVSAQPIEVATRITETMVCAKAVPAPMVPRDAFTDAEALVGRVTGMSIVPGIPITKQMLAPPGSEPGLRAKIPAGYRAVSLKVNEESAVAGFIMPGSRVDVLVAGRRGNDTSSRTILTDVEVGAVGQSLSQVGQDGKTVRMSKSVTLFLKPEEVQILHSNSGRGKFRLALRGDADGPESGSSWGKIVASVGASIGSIKPKVEVPKKVKVAALRQHVVETVRGDKRAWLVFDELGGVRQFSVQQGSSSSQLNGNKGDEDSTSDSSEMEMGE